MRRMRPSRRGGLRNAKAAGLHAVGHDGDSIGLETVHTHQSVPDVGCHRDDVIGAPWQGPVQPATERPEDAAREPPRVARQLRRQHGVRVINQRNAMAQPGRQGYQQSLDMVRVDDIEPSRREHASQLPGQRRIVDRELAQARSHRHLPIDRAPKDPVHRYAERLRPVRHVIGDELDVVAARRQRFRQPLDAQRRTPPCRHGACGHHRNPESLAGAAHSMKSGVLSRFRQHDRRRRQGTIGLQPGAKRRGRAHRHHRHPGVAVHQRRRSASR